MANTISPALLDAAVRNYRTVYDGAFDKQTTWSEELFEKQTSETAEEVYSFLDRVPKLREWIGPRRYEALIAQAYRLKNRKFELSVSVPREDIEDDRIQIWNPRVRRMGSQSKKWPDHLAKETLQGGKTATCFDGKAFFATNHYISYGKKTGSQANLFTSKALTYDNYVAVKAAMRAMKGGDGEPLEDFGEDLILVVDDSNEDAANAIVKADSRVIVVKNAAGTENVGAAQIKNTQANSARVKVVSALSNEPGVWYLADVSGEKPFIFQERYAPDFTPRFDPASPRVFELDEYDMGVRARGATGYGLWWKIARCEP